MQREAVLSPCGLYRYSLTRSWPSIYTRQVCIVMLNPSTADAAIDDPTIRRCIGFAQRDGCKGFEVVNLAAYRATQPRDMLRAADPRGPDNDAALHRAAQAADDVWVAWGANATPELVDPAVAILRQHHPQLWCLGTTQAGHPRHPLYLKAGAPLVVWP